MALLLPLLLIRKPRAPSFANGGDSNHTKLWLMYKLFTPALPLNHNKNLRWVLFLVLVELFPAPHLISHNASTSVRGQGPSYLWWQRWASQVALVAKNPPASAGDIRDAGSIPGSGRPPGGGHGNPLQSSCLENPMDRGGWWATFHRVAKSQTRLKRPSMHASCLCRADRTVISALISQPHWACTPV